MRLLVTGGIGVLGRATLPLLRAQHHVIHAPAPGDLDLFDAEAVACATDGAEAIVHLATHIPPRERAADREAWRENDRLRAEASRLLVDGALAATTAAYVQPSVTFLYPQEGVVDEETPPGPAPDHLRSALAAEGQAARFAAAGRRGVVLRLGLLDGPGTSNERPNERYQSTLHVADAARALVAALDLPSGIYNVCRDGEHVSNGRFKRATGWRHER